MRADLAAPDLAWPTLGLTAAVLAGWSATLAAALGGLVPAPLAVAALTLFAYLSFTPMHDASHRSVSRHAVVNEAVGRLAGIPLLAPFVAFRFVHLEHHKNTNEPERDPDLWSGGRLRPSLPLRWLSQDLHYYAFYFARFRERPRGETIEALISLIALWGVVALAIATGHAREALLFWVLPGRLGIGLLAFSFDYLPHSPHVERGRTARFTNTSNLRLTASGGAAWLTPVLLFQNYHLVHHLYPGVPFYRYAKVWRAQEKGLRVKGATDRALLDAILGRPPLTPPSASARS